MKNSIKPKVVATVLNIEPIKAHSRCSYCLGLSSISSDGLTGTAANGLESGYFSESEKSVVILSNQVLFSRPAIKTAVPLTFRKLSDNSISTSFFSLIKRQICMFDQHIFPLSALIRTTE